MTDITLPAHGFSPFSVFLNLHYLLFGLRQKEITREKKRVFPWVLWHLWKARNAKTFENVDKDPHTIVSQAYEEETIWLHVNSPREESEIERDEPHWIRPLVGTSKCNVGSFPGIRLHVRKSGAAWILRDHAGKVLQHSCRAHFQVFSQVEADLRA